MMASASPPPSGQGRPEAGEIPADRVAAIAGVTCVFKRTKFLLPPVVPAAELHTQQLERGICAKCHE